MRPQGRPAKLASVLDGALDSADEMIRKRVQVAMLGLACHAIYFVMWTFVYPQPHESLPLRLLLSAMFLPFLVPQRWVERLDAAWPAYWQLTLMLNLPFFFTYMALRNDTWLWVASLQAALLLVYLLTTVALTTWLIILGVGVGALCAAPFGIDWPNTHVVQAWPVLIFTLLGGTVLSRSQVQRGRRKTAALMSYAGYIAHELRTPLASIAARASLTRLSEPHAGLDQTRHLDELSLEVQRAFALIDILLTNIDPMRHAQRRGAAQETPTQEQALISNVVADALARYPFRDASERAGVQVHVEQDCNVRGSPLLLQHVVMNVMRNAFEHGRAGGAVKLGITARRRAHACELSIEDNGRGFTAGASNQTGLGLMFCRNVARSIGGELRVSASAQGGCRIRLTLPSID